MLQEKKLFYAFIQNTYYIEKQNRDHWFGLWYDYVVLRHYCTERDILQGRIVTGQGVVALD